MGVIWIYDLIANPDGEQLSATFTLAASETKAFGDQDVKLIGSIQWASKERVGSKAAR